ncbi:unnamed protein product, partial [Ilex paraguariensis]
PNRSGLVNDDLHDDDLGLEFDNLPLLAGANKSGSGIYGAVFNLTTSVIGAGIMALSATMKVLGLILGIVLIILMGILLEVSVELLVRFSVQCKASSYGEVVQAALCRTARVLSEICIIVNNAGVLVVYLIIMGDVMSDSFHHLLLSFSKGKLRRSKNDSGFWVNQTILDLLVVIPIMSNAYVCHFNVQPIYNELEGCSPEMMNRVGRITTVLCVLVYASTAIAGYLLFGKDTESDVLTNFDKDLGIRFSTALNYIVRFGYIFLLVIVFSVIHFSLRQTVDALVFEGSAPLAESRKRCLALTVLLLGLIYLGSTMITNIWTAFKFTGATTAVSLGFTFPSLTALRLSKQKNGLTKGENFLSWLMLILAVIVSIVGVIGNIYSMESQSE